jgi:hypothetical protein
VTASISVNLRISLLSKYSLTMQARRVAKVLSHLRLQLPTIGHEPI